MTEEQAKQLYKSEFWKEMSYRERATFQLYERRLCMPFSIFQEAIEKTLDAGIDIETEPGRYRDNRKDRSSR